MSVKAVNVNDIIDRAKFSGFHFQVVAWCLLIILFDGEFKHEVRQFQKPYDNQQAEQISLMV